MARKVGGAVSRLGGARKRMGGGADKASSAKLGNPVMRRKAGGLGGIASGLAGSKSRQTRKVKYSGGMLGAGVKRRSGTSLGRVNRRMGPIGKKRGR